MSLSRLLINLVRTAGAKSEADTERDGFLSYKSETHSVAYGLGLGAAVAFHLLGVPVVLPVVLAALGGVVGKRRLGNERVWREIRDEPQYFVPSIVVGFLSVGLPAALLGAFAVPAWIPL